MLFFLLVNVEMSTILLIYEQEKFDAQLIMIFLNLKTRDALENSNESLRQRFSPRCYKFFFMLKSAEHEILNAH